MYSPPSTSQRIAPCARATKNGSRPSPRKARTGEFTPPGMRRRARAKSSEESADIAPNVQRSTLNAITRSRGDVKGLRGDVIHFNQRDTDGVVLSAHDRRVVIGIERGYDG